MAAQVRVVKFFGGGEPLGLMSALVGMETNLGQIVQVSGQLVRVSPGLYTVAGTSGWVYDHQLSTLFTHATGTWSWPTGDASVWFGRAGTWPSGVPVLSSSGMCYKGADVRDVIVFSRP